MTYDEADRSGILMAQLSTDQPSYSTTNQNRRKRLRNTVHENGELAHDEIESYESANKKAANSCAIM